MLRSLVLESLSGIHFSVEKPEKVADVVTELVEAQVARAVRLVVDETKTADGPDRQGTTPVDQPASTKKPASAPKK